MILSKMKSVSVIPKLSATCSFVAPYVRVGIDELVVPVLRFITPNFRIEACPKIVLLTLVLKSSTDTRSMYQAPAGIWSILTFRGLSSQSAD